MPGMDVVASVGVLFLLMAIGAGCRFFRIFEDKALDGMSRLLINVAMPAMILVSLQAPFSPDLLVQAGQMVGSQTLLYLLAVPLTVAFLGLLRVRGSDRGVLEYGSVFGNVAFMGFPVVQAAFGSQGLFLASLCIVPFSFLAFSLGAWLIARRGNAPFALTVRTFVNPNSVATIAGFLLFLMPFRLPEFALKALSLAGGLTTPLSMVVCGYILAGTDLKRAFSSRGIYGALVSRLVLMPAGFLGLLWLMGFRGMALAVPVMLAAMPAASNTPVMARLYGGDEQAGSAFMASSTLLSIVSIPLAGMAASLVGA